MALVETVVNIVAGGLSLLSLLSSNDLGDLIDLGLLLDFSVLALKHLLLPSLYPLSLLRRESHLVSIKLLLLPRLLPSLVNPRLEGALSHFSIILLPFQLSYP